MKGCGKWDHLSTWTNQESPKLLGKVTDDQVAHTGNIDKAYKYQQDCKQTDRQVVVMNNHWKILPQGVDFWDQDHQDHRGLQEEDHQDRWDHQDHQDYQDLLTPRNSQVTTVRDSPQ